GCLRTDIELSPGRLLHFFNVHLGTSWLERRRQARRLLAEVLAAPGLTGPRLLVGDLNEWTRGLATRLLSEHMHSADIRPHLRRSRTYPGVFPFLHLDHIYFDPPLRLERVELVRTRLSLLASDHLPLVAEFAL
ncbi:MAG: endonuclease/exonuclease/phosphatase family protein, partial [Deltaproteobacteria bacterium]